MLWLQFWKFILKCANYTCICHMVILFHYLPGKANSSHKPTFFLEITTLFLLSCCVGWQVEISEKKKNYSLRSCYHKLPNRKKLILPLEKYFKTLNDIFVGTPDAKPLQSFTIFQSGRNNGVKIWVFDATRGISRELPLILILKMKTYFSVMFHL